MEGDNKMSENGFFCRNSERHGGDYMEFGFCRRSNMKNVFSNVTNWSDDSLYVVRICSMNLWQSTANISSRAPLPMARADSVFTGSIITAQIARQKYSRR